MVKIGQVGSRWLKVVSRLVEVKLGVDPDESGLRSAQMTRHRSRWLDIGAPAISTCLDLSRPNNEFPLFYVLCVLRFLLIYTCPAKLPAVTYSQ